MEDELEFLSQPFSKRHNYAGGEVEIRIREDAPPSFRSWLPRLGSKIGMSAHAMRSIVCEVLHEPPDQDNLSDGDVFQEVESLLLQCPWYRVYDVAEGFGDWAVEDHYDTLCGFAESLNEFFREKGIGWELSFLNGIISRGEIEFVRETKQATEVLNEAGLDRAKRELHEAIADLSRRPEPDLTGAIQHAMAAMECVAREYCGEQQSTFGKLIERYPDMLPRPLNQGVEKAWGYASEMGRHVREGSFLNRDEAELIVAIAASVSTYLIRKKRRQEEGHQ
jgi:hypothetical protein